ncbi:hypothetical protein KBY96_12780 [Cyanobium sp. ATX 6A2]|uniref:hypothetical protein n=1 Tax=Cyanobium sp. ATX 6A2 TaxID=2823700 RepID=UPI0020CC3DEB|nr:hypothetical protein [Cyanobium sp. ATX 6A2]MCP9888799.1 hypothetical protein [Cyanobium sp. ATX 6A2]
MADESSTPAPQAGRNAGTRDGGGFRIRLSDNEMRSARSIQEAFRLRSTVAVLGFSVRAIAQLLEEGKLDELVAQQQEQAGPRREGGRDGERGGRGDGGRSEGARREGPRGEGRGGRQERQNRIDPFARPARPTTPAPAEAAPEPQTESTPEAEPALEAEPQPQAEPEAPIAAESAETTDER